MLHGSFSAIMQDEDGQITEAHSISAGLDYPGSGPEHAWLRDSGRARYVAVTDAAGARRVPPARRARGHHPGARVLARGRLGARRARRATATLDLVCLSGRGDKDLAEVLERPGMSTATGQDTIAAAFASRGKRAALMPYLMGGFPDARRRRARSARPTPRPAPTWSSSASRSPTRSPTAR